MTISQSIASWLKEYDQVDITQINTDLLEATSNSYGLLKGSINSSSDFSDGSKIITQYFQFSVRQFSQTENQRIDNQKWLQDFEKWVINRNTAGDLPDFGTDYTCQEININNSFFAYSTSEEDSIYQITLQVIYTNF